MQELGRDLSHAVVVPYGEAPPAPADIVAGAQAGALAQQALDERVALDGANASDDFAENVAFLSGLPDTFAYPLADRLREERSVMEFIPQALHAGIRAGTNVVPVHAFIQKAFDSGARRIRMPEGRFRWGPSAYVVQGADGQQIVGAGEGTILERPGAAGVPVVPFIISQGEGVIVTDMRCEAGAQASLPPVMGGGQIAFGCAFLFMGDGHYSEGLSVFDAWDNGIGVGRYDLITGAQTNGSPVGGVHEAHYTYNCGCGVRPAVPGGLTTHQAGSGINNLTGVGTQINNCADWFSRTGFINDYGSGATGTFKGCVSYYARKSRVAGDSYPSEEARLGGFGIYGAGRGQTIGCEVYDAESDGMWLDGYAHNWVVRGFRAKGCRQRSALIEGRDNTVEVISEDASYGVPGAFAAITLRGTADDGAGGFTHSRNLLLVHPVTTGGDHSLGVQVVSGDGGRKVHGALLGGSLNGRTGMVSNACPGTFALRGYSISNPPSGVWTGANTETLHDGVQIISAEGINAATTPWGDATGRGHLWLMERRNPAKKLVVGFDGDRDAGVIQATETGAAARALDLNPNPAPTRMWNRNESGGTVGEVRPAALEVRAFGTGKRLVGYFDAPANIAILQSIEPGVSVRGLDLNPYGGAVRIGSTTGSEVWVSIPGMGLKKLELGAADSAGAGYRTLRVLN